MPAKMKWWSSLTCVLPAKVCTATYYRLAVHDYNNMQQKFCLKTAQYVLLWMLKQYTFHTTYFKMCLQILVPRTATIPPTPHSSKNLGRKTIFTVLIYTWHILSLMLHMYVLHIMCYVAQDAFKETRNIWVLIEIIILSPHFEHLSFFLLPLRKSLCSTTKFSKLCDSLLILHSKGTLPSSLD